MSSETDPAVLQVTPVQLQRFVIMFRDQESSEEDGNKLFFQLTRASASVFGTFSGSIKKRTMWDSTRTRGLLNLTRLVYFV